MASSERVFQLLDHPIDITDPEDPRELPLPARGEISIEGRLVRLRERTTTVSPTGCCAT